MVNPWIQHIKNYASKNNLTYGCALSDPKCRDAYKNKTSTTTTTKTTIKVEDSFDSLSGKLQQLIYITPIDKIKSALIKLNYKGRIPTNKLMLNMQLLQNFNTSDKIKELINELSANVMISRS